MRVLRLMILWPVLAASATIVSVTSPAARATEPPTATESAAASTAESATKPTTDSASATQSTAELATESVAATPELSPVSPAVTANPVPPAPIAVAAGPTAPTPTANPVNGADAGIAATAIRNRADRATAGAEPPSSHVADGRSLRLRWLAPLRGARRTLWSRLDRVGTAEGRRAAFRRPRSSAASGLRDLRRLAAGDPPVAARSVWDVRDRRIGARSVLVSRKEGVRSLPRRRAASRPGHPSG